MRCFGAIASIGGALLVMLTAIPGHAQTYFRLGAFDGQAVYAPDAACFGATGPGVWMLKSACSGTTRTWAVLPPTKNGGLSYVFDSYMQGKQGSSWPSADVNICFRVWTYTDTGTLYSSTADSCPAWGTTFTWYSPGTVTVPGYGHVKITANFSYTGSLGGTTEARWGGVAYNYN